MFWKMKLGSLGEYVTNAKNNSTPANELNPNISANLFMANLITTAVFFNIHLNESIKSLCII